MKKALLLLVIVLSVIALAGCTGGKPVLRVYNWGDYIDEDIFKTFEEETGYKVVYETFQTNEEMYAKIKNSGSSYDVLIPSDYMIEKMIKEDMISKLDFTKIPNYANIDDRFKNLDFDPNNEYSVPYFWGTVGIAYNSNIITDEIDSWTVLWDEKYAKQFTMLDSQRDAIMVALKVLGYSMNTHDEAHLEQAKELLIKQKPKVLAYAGDNVKDMLISGEAAMAVVWSGEAGNVIAENPHIKYSIPKEGTNIWFDNIVIPKNAKNVDGAHAFIDFLCRPEIGQKNADYVGYATCNKETMKLLDPELFPTTYAYPLPEWYEGAEVFKDPGDFLKVYNRIWTEIKAN